MYFTPDMPVIPFGPPVKFGNREEQLFVCSTSSTGNPQDFGQTLMIDQGSKSIKCDRYDLPVSRESTGDWDQFDRLGRYMKPDDEQPMLNPDGIDSSLKITYPTMRKLIQEWNITTVGVFCTEATRAAYAYDQKQVEAYLCEVAKTLGIPRKAINILSKKMEAYLGLLAVSRAHRMADGYVFIMGGNSLECVEISYGSIANIETLRIGTNSLESAKDPLEVIQEQLGQLHWLKDNPGRNVYLVGGPFRPVGRELAQRFYNIKYDADPCYGGFNFNCDAVLRSALNDLSVIKKDDLFKSFVRMEYPGSMQLHGNAAKAWQHYSYDEIAEQMTTRKYKAWEKTPFFKEHCAKWDKRIGRRGDTINIAAMFIREVINLTRPSLIDFSNHTMRDGLIDLGVLRPRLIL